MLLLALVLVSSASSAFYNPTDSKQPTTLEQKLYSTAFINTEQKLIQWPDGSTAPLSALPDPQVITTADIENLSRLAETQGYIVEFWEEPLVVHATKNKGSGTPSMQSYKQELQQKRTDHLNEIEALVPTAKATREFDTLFNGAAFHISETEAKELETLPFVKKVHANQRVQALLRESVPQIRADQVWQLMDGQGRNITGQGVSIAIIDTGVDYAQPELGGCFGTGCKVADGYDFVNNDSDPMDDHGHGTHVAATAAGKSHNANELNGVAPDATIYAYKVLDAGGWGTWEHVIAGMERTVDPNHDGDTSDHVDVINLSLGGSGNPDDAASQAADRAVDAGVVVVIAAGNSGPASNTIGSPGTSRKAITVAAVDKSNHIANFSSRGPVVWTDAQGMQQTLEKPDIAAPGVNICAAQWDSAWSYAPCDPSLPNHVAISGTSMATPHAAGVAALIKQWNPFLDPSQVKQLLKSTAANQGHGRYAEGAGLLDAISATQARVIGGEPMVLSDSPVEPTTWLQSVSSFTNLTSDDMNFSLVVENDNSPMMAVSVQPGTLAVPAHGSATYSITFAIDNDQAVSGSVLPGSIQAVDFDGIEATTPFSISVKDRVALVQSEPEFYLGIDNPNLPAWSKRQLLTITNIQSYRSQGVALDASDFATIRGASCDGAPCAARNAISLSVFDASTGEQIPGNAFTLQAMESKNVLAEFTVDNSRVSNAAYYHDPHSAQWPPWKLGALVGTLSISTENQPAIDRTFSFSKCHAARFSWGSNMDWMEGIRKDDNTSYGPEFGMIENKLFCAEEAGEYDFIHWMGNDFIVNENVILDGETALSINRSDAIHSITLATKDLNGNPLAPQWKYIFGYKGTRPMASLSACGSSGTCPRAPTIRTNTLSPNYLLYYMAYAPMGNIQYNASETADQYFFAYDLEGVDGSVVLSNAPEDFKTVNVAMEPNQAGERVSFRPTTDCFFDDAIGFCISDPLDYQTLSGGKKSFPLHVIPFSGQASSASAHSRFSWGSLFAYFIFNPDDPSSPAILSPFVRFKQNTMERYGFSTVFPEQDNPTAWNIGTTPVFWNAKIISGETETSIFPYYNNGAYPTDGTFFTSPAFDSLGYAYFSPWRKNIPAVFTVLDSSGNIISEAMMREGLFTYNAPISLPQAGKYSIESLVRYNVFENLEELGRDYAGTLRATFDTRLAEKNPPTLAALEFRNNGNYSNQANFSRGKNVLAFSLDPVGGTLQKPAVTFGSAALGIPTQFVPVTGNGFSFEAVIPKKGVASVGPADFTIIAQDDSGNELRYGFQLPVIPLEKSRITNDGTKAVKGTLKIVAEQQQSNGSWSVVRTLYEQQQTIQPQNTLFLWDVLDNPPIVFLQSGTYRIKEGMYDSASGKPLQSNDGAVEYVKSFDVGPFTISSIQSDRVRKTDATISWSTSHSANETVEYGAQGYANQLQDLNRFALLHSITLHNLLPNTTYHYRVSSCNSSGDCSTSADQTFKTKKA